MVLGVVAALLLRRGPVDVVPPKPPADAAAACAALALHLPATVAGEDRRAVDPSSDLTAAWGNPPVVLRCGVGVPSALTATSELTTIDGIDWFDETVDGGSRYTTVGLVANVEVTVPSDLQPAANALVDLGGAISGAVHPLPATT